MKRSAKWNVLIAVPMVALTLLCFAASYEFGTHTHAHGIDMGAGILASGDYFLDGSQSIFQCGGWHLDDGTKCWGNRYGIQVGRFFWEIEVRHGRPEDCDP